MRGGPPAPAGRVPKLRAGCRCSSSLPSATGAIASRPEGRNGIGFPERPCSASGRRFRWPVPAETRVVAPAALSCCSCCDVARRQPRLQWRQTRSQDAARQRQQPPRPLIARHPPAGSGGPDYVTGTAVAARSAVWVTDLGKGRFRAVSPPPTPPSRPTSPVPAPASRAVCARLRSRCLPRRR